MAHGGPRVGAGRPKKASAGSPKKSTDREIRREARTQGLTPLEYMLDVMNDAQADAGRRDRMAVAAAPYVHGKAAESAPGKKEQRQTAANEAATGKFAVPQAPKLVVNNR